MNWFLISLIPPVAYALVNHIDKYLLSSYGDEEQKSDSLLIFSSFFGVVVAAVLAAYSVIAGIDLSVEHIGWLLLVGVLQFFAVKFYLEVLFDEDPALAIPMFEFIPVLVLVIEVLFFGAIIKSNHVLAILLIVVGSFILSFDSQAKRLKTKVLMRMLGSSLCYALTYLVFRATAVNEVAAGPLIWVNLGLAASGAVYYFLSKARQNEFRHMIKSGGKRVLALNITNETLNGIAFGATGIALAAAPSASVVTVIGSLQTFAVLATGYLLVKFLPKYVKAENKPTALVRLAIIIPIILIFLGVVLINYDFSQIIAWFS